MKWVNIAEYAVAEKHGGSTPSTGTKFLYRGGVMGNILRR